MRASWQLVVFLQGFQLPIGSFILFVVNLVLHIVQGAAKVFQELGVNGPRIDTVKQAVSKRSDLLLFSVLVIGFVRLEVLVA